MATNVDDITCDLLVIIIAYTIEPQFNDIMNYLPKSFEAKKKIRAKVALYRCYFDVFYLFF